MESCGCRRPVSLISMKIYELSSTDRLRDCSLGSNTANLVESEVAITGRCLSTIGWWNTDHTASFMSSLSRKNRDPGQRLDAVAGKVDQVRIAFAFSVQLLSSECTYICMFLWIGWKKEECFAGNDKF